MKPPVQTHVARPELSEHVPLLQVVDMAQVASHEPLRSLSWKPMAHTSHVTPAYPGRQTQRVVPVVSAHVPFMHVTPEQSGWQMPSASLS